MWWRLIIDLSNNHRRGKIPSGRAGRHRCYYISSMYRTPSGAFPRWTGIIQDIGIGYRRCGVAENFFEGTGCFLCNWTEMARHLHTCLSSEKLRRLTSICRFLSFNLKSHEDSTGKSCEFWSAAFLAAQLRKWEFLNGFFFFDMWGHGRCKRGTHLAGLCVNKRTGWLCLLHIVHVVGGQALDGRG